MNAKMETEILEQETERPDSAKIGILPEGVAEGPPRIGAADEGALPPFRRDIVDLVRHVSASSVPRWAGDGPPRMGRSLVCCLIPYLGSAALCDGGRTTDKTADVRL